MFSVFLSFHVMRYITGKRFPDCIFDAPWKSGVAKRVVFQKGGFGESALVLVFRSGGTCECTLVPVFVPGEHANVPSFQFSFREHSPTTLLENHPFRNPRKKTGSTKSLLPFLMLVTFLAGYGIIQQIGISICLRSAWSWLVVVAIRMAKFLWSSAIDTSVTTTLIKNLTKYWLA